MKKILLLIVLTTTISSIHAQQSDFTSAGRGVATTFVTDYHTVGINPANLGFKRKYERKHVTFGLAEVGFSGYSGALEKKDFRKSLTDFGDSDFTYEDKVKAAAQFTNENLALNADINLFGISYQNDKIGGFAFNIRENARWFSNFNQNMSEIMFLGYKAPYFDSLQLNNGSTVANDPSQYAAYESMGGIKSGSSTNPQLFSQIFEGSKISLALYREYNLSYGKEFKLNDNFAIAGGVGLKYIQGYGIMNIEVKDGKLTSYGAFSPAFNIDFGSASKSNPSADTTSNGYKSVGRGFGTDIGFNLYYKEKIKIGFSFVNIGSITWNGNVYTAQDQKLDTISSGGFDSYNIFAESGKITGGGFFTWEGKKKLTTQLPTMFRMGASYQLEDKAEIGIDIIVPMNQQPGTIKKPYCALGGDLRVLKFLRLSSGIAYGGNFDKRVNIPVGITFILGEQGTWEFGFASRDAVTYFREKGPALSLAFGFLRFRV